MSPSRPKAPRGIATKVGDSTSGERVSIVSRRHYPNMKDKAKNETLIKYTNSQQLLCTKDC